MNRHKVSTLILVILLSFAAVQIASSQVQTPSQTAQPAIVVFYAEDCPDCVRMEEVLDELLVDHPDLTVARYEIDEPGNSGLLWRLASQYGVLATKVPVIFVGEEAIVGAGRAEELRLRTAIDECVSLGCSSPLAGTQRSGFPWRDLFSLGVFVSLFFFLLFLQNG